MGQMQRCGPTPGRLTQSVSTIFKTSPASVSVPLLET
jgi:hypothetical protein